MTRFEDQPWLLPFEFHVIQRLYYRRGIWKEGDLVDDLVRWIRTDAGDPEWVSFRETEMKTNLRDLFERRVCDFLFATADAWNSHEYAERHFDVGLKYVQKRTGMERLVWQREVRSDPYQHYFSVNEESRRLNSTMEFSFAGQRAGSERHQMMVTEYAKILQNKGRYVDVDKGSVESKLPDIKVWFPFGPFQWNLTDNAAVEVEIDARRKSDEAILRNMRKQTWPVRFVVLSEEDCERVSSVIKDATGSSPRRVENYPADFGEGIEIEVVTSEQPLRDFIRSTEVPGAKEALTRRGFESRFPKIMSKREREAAERAKEWEEAGKLAEQGDDFLLSQLRRKEYWTKVAKEDRKWFESHARRGIRPRVLPRRKWPKPDAESN